MSMMLLGQGFEDRKRQVCRRLLQSLMAGLLSLSTFADSTVNAQVPAQSGVTQRTVLQNTARQNTAGQSVAGQNVANPRIASQRTAAPQNPQVAVRPTRPFPPLNPQQQAELDQVLAAWQAKSQSTKTLECKFEQWHFDLMKAPAGIHAHKAAGEIKYANPDKGLFRVDSMMFYKGMIEGKPQYGPDPNQYGAYWVCNGVELIEYDRTEKKCNVQSLPPSMQGTQIFNSPLPFVFNLDAEKIKQRYWVQLLKSPKPNTFLIQAYPKLREDRAQYKMVQVVLSAQFEPEVLLMYAPNFDKKLAPQWDHYEFKDVKRNAIGAGIQQFMGNFIPKQPPKGWEITKQNFQPPQIAQEQSAPAQRQ